MIEQKKQKITNSPTTYPSPSRVEDSLRGKGGEGSLYSEKGIALVMVLVMSAIVLAIIGQLIYFVTQGTKISGMEKRYKTALEASMGGADVTYELMGARGDPGIPDFPINITASAACLTAKLNTLTSVANWAGCNDYNKATSFTIDPADPDTYDMTFSFGTAPLQYDVYSKIVDTVEGNSAADIGLIITGVLNPGEIQVKSIPYLYTVEVDTENSTNAAERAKLSILYQY